MTTLEKIRRLREQKGFSQEYMAHRTGTSQAFYSKLELGKCQLTLERLKQIAEALEISMSDLIDPDLEASKTEAGFSLYDLRIRLLEEDIGLLKSIVRRLLETGGGVNKTRVAKAFQPCNPRQ